MNVFTTPINVRFMDIDVMGHVNHTIVIGYFTEGRNRFLDKHYSGFSPHGFPFIMAYVGCHYHKPINLEDNVLLEVWVKEIRNKSFKLGYKLVRSDDISITYAIGESVQVCYDYKYNASIPIPYDLRMNLESYHHTDSE